MKLLPSGNFDTKRGCGINVYGPGGSARRLHHEDMRDREQFFFMFSCGAETGSTCVIKTSGGIRDGTCVLGHAL